MMRDVELPEKKDVPRQKLWPIFLCGFLLAGFGFYFVFGIDEEEREPDIAIHDPGELGADLELDNGEGEPTVRIVYRAADRQYRVVATQVAEREGAEELTTSIRFLLTDISVSPRDDEAFAVERNFRDVIVTVEAGDERYGLEVTNEVVRLLETATLRLGYESDGQLVRTEVVSSESAQLRPTLDLVGDVSRFLFPPVPAESVNVGESWSLEFPSSVRGSDALDVEGGINVEGNLASTSEDEALLRMTVSGATRSTWDDGEDNAGHVEVNHSGTGEWVWGLESGRPERGRWSLERQTLEPGGAPLEEATITIRFDNADGPSGD